jgi:hypothetical protein
MDFLDDPEGTNDNLPEGYVKRKDFAVEFVKNLPTEQKQKIKDWIMANDIKKKKLTYSPISDFLGIAAKNAVNAKEHIAKAAKGSPTSRSVYRAEVDAQERQINWDALPGGRATLVMSSIPSRKFKDGSVDTRRWNWLMQQVDAWDRAGRPTAVDKHLVTSRVSIDRDDDPSLIMRDNAFKPKPTKEEIRRQAEDSDAMLRAAFPMVF